MYIIIKVGHYIFRDNLFSLKKDIVKFDSIFELHGGEDKVQAVIDYMKVMNVELQHIRNRDAKMVQQAIPLLMNACSYVRVSKDKDFSGQHVGILIEKLTKINKKINP